VDLGNSFVVCRWGGLIQAADLRLCCSKKISKFKSRSAMAMALIEGATAMMAAQGRQVQHCRGSGGGASVGCRRQCILVGGASVAPSDALAVALAAAHQRNYGGGIVGAVGRGSTSVGWWWSKATIKRGR